MDALILSLLCWNSIDELDSLGIYFCGCIFVQFRDTGGEDIWFVYRDFHHHGRPYLYKLSFTGEQDGYGHVQEFDV